MVQKRSEYSADVVIQLMTSVQDYKVGSCPEGAMKEEKGDGLSAVMLAF